MHCRKLNAAFNCFWLRSVGWVWVKSYQETVGNREELYSEKCTDFQAHSVCSFCLRAHYMRLPEHNSLFVHVSAFLFVCKGCIRERVSDLWVCGGKGHMAYQIMCSNIVQYFAFFPPWNWKPWPLQKYLETEIRPRTLVGLGIKTERKTMPTKPVFWSFTTCVGVEFHPLFCTVKSVSRWRGKLSVKFMMHFTNVKLHTVWEALRDLSLYHVFQWVLCHWDSFLHFCCLNMKRGLPQWNKLLLVELML